jgi:hypothetical protein
MAIFIALDYYVLSWKEYQVVAQEGYSETISIVTVRKSKSGLEGVLLSADQRREQQERVWKEGVWTLQVSDYIKRFPRIYGNVSPYTPYHHSMDRIMPPDDYLYIGKTRYTRSCLRGDL